MWHQICTKALFWMQMLRKSLLENAFDVKFVQNFTLKANAQKIVTWKCIWPPHMCKTVTLQENPKDINYCTNAFGTKYVQNRYFESKW